MEDEPSMRKVTIYTTTYCPYCRRAKILLNRLKIPFEEINVEDDDEKREWLVEVTGEKTVPQIFFDDEAIGGFMDLQELENKDQLVEKLNARA
jgi:glutaredoxin 3